MAQRSGVSGRASPSSNTGTRCWVRGPGHRLDPEKPARGGGGEGPDLHESPESGRGELLDPAAGGAFEGRREPWILEGDCPSTSWRRAEAERGGLELSAAGVASLPRGFRRPADEDERSPHLFVRGCERRISVHPRGRVRGGDRPGRTRYSGCREADYTKVPWCTYTDPEVASVGLNEKRAKAAGVGIPDSRGGVRDVDRALGGRGDGGEDQGADQSVRSASGMPESRGITPGTDPRMGRAINGAGEALHACRCDPRYPTLAENFSKKAAGSLLTPGKLFSDPDEEDPAFPLRPEGEGVHAGRRGVRMKARKILILLVFAAVVAAFYFLDLGKYLTLESLRRTGRGSRICATHTPSCSPPSSCSSTSSRQRSPPGGGYPVACRRSDLRCPPGDAVRGVGRHRRGVLGVPRQPYLLRDWVGKNFGGRMEGIDHGCGRAASPTSSSCGWYRHSRSFSSTSRAASPGCRSGPTPWARCFGIMPGSLVFVNAGASLADIET